MIQQKIEVQIFDYSGTFIKIICNKLYLAGLSGVVYIVTSLYFVLIISRNTFCIYGPWENFRIQANKIQTF